MTIRQQIGAFQSSLTGYFRELTLAAAFIELGGRNAEHAPGASVQLHLGRDEMTEPMQMGRLKTHQPAVAKGACELFESKAVAAWGDLLAGLFMCAVHRYVTGGKTYPGVKLRFDLDLGDADPVSQQVEKRAGLDFPFLRYSERIKNVKAAFPIGERYDQDFLEIKKHVVMRNSFQHHSGSLGVTDLRELGTHEIELLAQDGSRIKRTAGDILDISVPECFQLKAALFRVSNVWRERYAEAEA